MKEVTNYLVTSFTNGKTCFGGFSGGSHGKESACSVEDLGLIPGLGRSGEGNDYPLQHSCLQKFHGQRSLAGYSPWGHKELDPTE